MELQFFIQVLFSANSRRNEEQVESVLGKRFSQEIFGFCYSGDLKVNLHEKAFQQLLVNW